MGSAARIGHASIMDEVGCRDQHALRSLPGRGAPAPRVNQSIISSMPGFRRLQLSRGHERPNVYLLLVEWDELEYHTEGFRQSSGYQQWKDLLHHFYDPFPVVEHYTPLDVSAL